MSTCHSPSLGPSLAIKAVGEPGGNGFLPKTLTIMPKLIFLLALALSRLSPPLLCNFYATMTLLRGWLVCHRFSTRTFTVILSSWRHREALSNLYVYPARLACLSPVYTRTFTGILSSWRHRQALSNLCVYPANIGQLTQVIRFHK